MIFWNEVNLTTHQGKKLLNQVVARAMGYYAEDVYNNGEWYLIAPDGELVTDEPGLNERQAWDIADLPDWASNLEDASMLLSEIPDRATFEAIFTSSAFMHSIFTSTSDQCVIRCIVYLEWRKKLNNPAFIPPYKISLTG